MKPFDSNPRTSFSTAIAVPRGIAKGDFDKAIADDTEAIRLDPKFAVTYSNRALAHDNKGEYAQAIADSDEAIRLNPKIASAHCHRGVALEKQGQYEQAIAEFDQALLLDPAYRRTYPTFAMFLATCPDEPYRDGKLALELATKAVKMDAEKTPEPLSALAAANAENEAFRGGRQMANQSN